MESARESTPDTLPASQYLQERLQERRARSARSKPGRQSDFGPQPGRDDDIFLNEATQSRHGSARAFDSSPMGAASLRNSEAGGRDARRRALGAKDINEHMDRLTKQNFALKLELDHRREHTAKLQDQIEGMRVQVERAEQLEHEHTELLRINTQLVEELEKRDKAIEEAMDIICDLEDKVSDLEERRSNTRPSTAHADSGYAGTETHEQPPQAKPVQPPGSASVVVEAPTPARPRREPHVLKEKKQSTHALRSVYLETSRSLHPVQSFNSLLTRQESKIDEEEAALDSPRLSVLSKSSFPSIYNTRDHVNPDKYDWEGEDEESVYDSPVHLRQDSINRVSQWMQERDQADETPTKSSRLSSQRGQGETTPSPSRRMGGDQFPSIAKTLSHGSKSSPRQIGGGQHIRTDGQTPTNRTPSNNLAGPIFGSPPLPPTPDSASTRMLRSSNSNSTLGDQGEMSLLEVTKPDVRGTPKSFRSSIDLGAAYHNYLRRRDQRAPLMEEEDHEGFPTDPPPHTRRQPSSEATLSPPPRLSRSETSPPNMPPTTTSPARTLSQKTHAFFTLRSSSKQPPTTPSPREKSPLPTLTRTPSSAYVRRPTTSDSKTAPRRPPTSMVESPRGRGRR